MEVAYREPASLLTRSRSVVNTLLEIIFPPVCVGCRRVGEVLCGSCQARLTPVPEPYCSRCGRQMTDVVEQPRLCPECRRQPSRVNQMRAAVMYHEPADTLIHRFKYDGYFALAKPFAALMVAGWPEWGTPPELIIPVPLHPRRERQRGFNQALLLAKPLAEATGLAVDSAALRRVRHTVPQVGLGPNERAENVRDAFAAVSTRISGRHILLVDDVLTTGATMRAAAEALLASGAASVSAYCLARVS